MALGKKIIKDTIRIPKLRASAEKNEWGKLKEALHPQRVLIRGSYAEPVGEAGGGGEAHLLEQGDGGLVFHAHADIALVEVEDMAGRVDQSADDGRSIAPAAVFDRHDQSDLRPLVARVEIDEVANAIADGNDSKKYKDQLVGLTRIIQLWRQVRRNMR